MVTETRILMSIKYAHNLKPRLQGNIHILYLYVHSIENGAVGHGVSRELYIVDRYVMIRLEDWPK